MPKPKKIIKEDEVLIERNIREELLALLKQRMPTCFDREPQGMNSGVERLADSILELLK